MDANEIANYINLIRDFDENMGSSLSGLFC